MMGIAEVNKEPHKQRQQLKERKLNKEKKQFLMHVQINQLYLVS